MNSSDQGRLLPLDSLRAIAALAVLLYHYTKGYEQIVGPHSAPVPGFALGYLGVELFFVISGFVIAWTLQRSASLADFAFGRIARLYPAYLACAAITGIVIFGFGFNPTNIQTGDIAWNAVIGLPPLVKANNLDASYWTLGVEVSFYVMAAAFTYGLPKLRIEIFCIVWLFTSLAARGLFPEAAQFQLLLASDYSPLFVAGAMLYYSHGQSGPIGLLLRLSQLPSPCASSEPIHVGYVRRMEQVYACSSHWFSAQRRDDWALY